MRAKGLLKLRAELETQWAAGRAPKLLRAGERVFLVDEEPSGGFSYEEGFATNLPTHAWGVSMRTIVLVVVGALALMVAIFLALPHWANEPKPAAVAKQPSATPTDACGPEPLEAVRPLNGNTSQKGTLLLRDIVIGGERAQEVRYACGDGETTYLLRFALAKDRWKAKSATPMGSHSLNGD